MAEFVLRWWGYCKSSGKFLYIYEELEVSTNELLADGGWLLRDSFKGTPPENAQPRCEELLFFNFCGTFFVIEDMIFARFAQFSVLVRFEPSRWPCWLWVDY